MLKTHKYNATKVVIDGIQFASTLEGNVYKALRDNPEVKILEFQPAFELQPGFRDARAGLTSKGQPVKVLAINHNSDFRIKYQGQEMIIEAKGMETADYKIKYKMLLHRYPNVTYHKVKSLKQLKELWIKLSPTS